MQLNLCSLKEHYMPVIDAKFQFNSSFGCGDTKLQSSTSLKQKLTFDKVHVRLLTQKSFKPFNQTYSNFQHIIMEECKSGNKSLVWISLSTYEIWHVKHCDFFPFLMKNWPFNISETKCSFGLHFCTVCNAFTIYRISKFESLPFVGCWDIQKIRQGLDYAYCKNVLCLPEPVQR